MEFSGKDLKIRLRERQFDFLWWFLVIFLPLYFTFQLVWFVDMIINDGSWFIWIDGILTGTIFCTGFIYLRDVYRTRKKEKIEKALGASRFAIEQGQYALLAMRRGLRDNKAQAFQNAFEEARAAFNFGLENYREAQRLSTAIYRYMLTYTVPDTSCEELEEIEELRTRLYQKASEDDGFMELLERLRLVQVSETSDENSEPSGTFPHKEPIEERFHVAWEKVRPGELDKWIRRSANEDYASRKEMEQATMTELTAKSWASTSSDDKVQWND